MSLNDSLLLIDVAMVCPVCGKSCRLVFSLPSACGRAGAFLNYMQKTAVQLITSTFRGGTGSAACGLCTKPSPGGAIIIPHTSACLCYSAREPLLVCRTSVAQGVVHV